MKRLAKFSRFLASAHGWYGTSSPTTTPWPAGAANSAPNCGGPGRAAMILHIPIRGIERLPDAVQVRFAAGDAGSPVVAPLCTEDGQRYAR